MKRSVRRKVKRKGNIERLKMLKKEYKELKRVKKKRWAEEIESKLKGIGNERQAWEFLNRDLRKKGGVTDRFSIEEWREYFIKSMGGKIPKEAEKG